MARGILHGIGGAGIDTDGLTATPGKVLNGDTFIGAGSDEPQTGAIPIKGAESYMPGTSNIVLPPGQYLGAEQTIFGDPGLNAANIKKGAIVFGVTGNYEGYYVGPTDLYNRGSWAEGYSNANIVVKKGVADDMGVYANLTFNQNSFTIGHGDIALFGVVFNKLINFAPFKTLNVVFNKATAVNSGPILYVYNMIPAYVVMPDNSIASVYGSSKGLTSEVTMSVDIRMINQACTFSIAGVDRIQTNIHKIYFTV